MRVPGKTPLDLRYRRVQEGTGGYRRVQEGTGYRRVQEGTGGYRAGNHPPLTSIYGEYRGEEGPGTRVWVQGWSHALKLNLLTHSLTYLPTYLLTYLLTWP